MTADRDLVLIPSPPPAEVVTACEEFDAIRLWEHADPEEVLRGCADRIVAIASPGEGEVSAALIDRLPRLGMISHFGVGYDSVDVAAAVARGIVVTNLSGSNADEVADLAIALMLMLVRDLPAAERHLREGRWGEGPAPLARGTVAGGRMGLLGLGSVGGAIARRAEAMRMSVAYTSRRRHPESSAAFAPDALSLARDSDVLVAALPAGKATDGLVDAAVLDALGPDGIFINVGRGNVVDPGVLADAVGAGRIRGAGLDVFPDEPNVDPRLLALDADRVRLVPHIGSATVAVRRRMAELGAANLRAWLRGEPVLTPIPECAHLERSAR